MIDNKKFQDENGFITVDELKEIFNQGKQKKIPNKIWEKLLREVDENLDGKVIICIFLGIYQQILDFF